MTPDRGSSPKTVAERVAERFMDTWLFSTVQGRALAEFVLAADEVAGEDMGVYDMRRYDAALAALAKALAVD